MEGRPPPSSVKWLDEAVADGTATTPAHPSRVRILAAARSDRAGPVATRLLWLAHAEEPVVRREAMDLLLSVTGERPWPEAVEAALTRLTDPDEEVRRRAAHLVGYRGQTELVLTALDDLADPMVRTVLARALGPAVARLRTDSLAAVRFLAHLEILRAAPPARRPALDRALLTDAREAAVHLADIGHLWGRVLHGSGRERHAYALVARLLTDLTTRETGAGLAREACHKWRAAPVTLLPLLIRYDGQESTPSLSAALKTALISGAARRRHRALIAGIPFAPSSEPHRSPFGNQPVYDSPSAAALLATKPVGIVRLGHATAIFSALLDDGPLTFRQAAQLYNLTFHHPGRSQAEGAPLWLRHAGSPALPHLLSLMTPHLADYAVGEFYLTGLARMGPDALPALPAVTAIIERRTRVPVNDSTPDAEMELDERLLSAALHTRRAIRA
ncbi:HEAT repeat domain-containing protein [Streptomyces sp. CA-179760]|uniref:HEAT repeat domain-containing protein n=1 Tax=Streptomyces sp. CA-179760 TaxID=3240054 RepID=UPI003D947EAE